MSNNSQQNNVSDTPIHPIPVDLTWEALTGRSSNSNEPAKKTWPELVGLPAEEAEKKIKEELEGAYTPVVPAGGFITFDFRTNRVRLFVDDAGILVQAPSIG